MRKRLEGVATNLARLAARQPSLFGLLQEDAEIGEATRQLKREMQQAGGLEPEPEAEPATPARGRRPRAPDDASRSPYGPRSWPTRSSSPTSAS